MVSGGLRDASSYAEEAYAGIEADLDALGVMPGGSVSISVTDRRGEDITTTAIGSGTAVAEIYGGNGTRLAQLTAMQSLAGGRVAIEAGRLGANVAFDHRPDYCQFQSGAICGIPVFIFRDSHASYWSAPSWGGQRPGLGDTTTLRPSRRLRGQSRPGTP